MVPAEPAPLGPAAPADMPHAVDDLTFEVALLYFRLRDAAEQVVGQGRHSAGRRSVLRTLHRGGPATSSEMARERSVSRQHVQKLVDELRRDGLVELSDNPRDRRAKLVSLTAKGRGLYAAMQARERALMEHLGAGIPERDVRTAVAVLRAVRARFDAEEWERLLR